MNDILVVSLQSLTQKEVAGPGKLGYYLAKQFNESNRLNGLVVSSKGKFETPFISFPVSMWSRYYLFLLNKAWQLGFLKYYQKRHLEEELFDFFLQFRITRQVKFLVTINPYLSRTLKRCKKFGVKTIFIPANPEESEINRTLEEARSRWKINTQEIDVYSYAPRKIKYEESLIQFDSILAHTSLVAESFLKRFNKAKIKEFYGLIWSVNQGNVPLANPSDKKFKIGYLAHTVLLKGLQDLLEAWSHINDPDCELHIGGEIDAIVKRLIESKYATLTNVFYHGHVSDANSFFSELNLFICPSIIDAVPVTVLEAAARQIPSIITDYCGVKDYIKDGDTGFVVPAQNPEALLKKISHCLNNREVVKSVGERAKAMVSTYSMEKYVRELSDYIVKA